MVAYGKCKCSLSPPHGVFSSLPAGDGGDIYWTMNIYVTGYSTSSLASGTSSLRRMSISRLDVRHICPFRNSEMGRSISGYAIRYLSRDQEIISTTVYRKLFTNK